MSKLDLFAGWSLEQLPLQQQQAKKRKQGLPVPMVPQSPVTRQVSTAQNKGCRQHQPLTEGVPSIQPARLPTVPSHNQDVPLNAQANQEQEETRENACLTKKGPYAWGITVECQEGLERTQWYLSYQPGSFPWTPGSTIWFNEESYALKRVGSNTLRVQARTQAPTTQTKWHRSGGATWGKRVQSVKKIELVVAEEPGAQAVQTSQSHHSGLWDYVEVQALPAILSRRLPPGTRRCFVERPKAVGCLFQTRLAASVPEKTTARPLFLEAQDAQQLMDLLTTPEPVREVRCAPAYFLSEDLQRQMCAAVSFPLPDAPLVDQPEDHAAIQPPCLFDYVYMVQTCDSSHDGMWPVEITVLSDRLDGWCSGHTWLTRMSQEHIEQSLPWSRELEHVDAMERRRRVNAYASQQGAIPPEIQPDTEKEKAFPASLLEEMLPIAVFKDPVELRAEDLAGANSQEDVLEQAVRSVRRRQIELQERIDQWQQTCAQAQSGHEQHLLLEEMQESFRSKEELEKLACWLEEIEIWCSELPPERRKALARERLLSCSPIIEEVDIPILSNTGKVKGYQRVERSTGSSQVVIGIPAAMFVGQMLIPWRHHVKDLVHILTEGKKPTFAVPGPIISGQRTLHIVKI